MRRDVEVHPRQQGGTCVFVLKDPLSLRYFQLQEEEHFLWRLLDGSRSFDELLSAFNATFAPRELRAGELQSFLARLLRDGLLISDIPGTSNELAQKAEAKRRASWTGCLLNPLMIRLPGWDPQRFLDATLMRTAWMFSRGFAWAAISMIALAILLVSRRFMATDAALIPLQSLLEPRNLVWLSLGLAIAKVLHEFGHALVCRRLGAECHEMGVMLLAFTPCLYCDVSDAWTLRNKWHRIAVSAAGIGVDLLLASFCAIVWCSTEPGFLNAMCLNVMFVCSVSTLIFNGNPLMRYDGYYVLQDLIEEPNLRPNARSWTRHVLVRWFTGVELLRASEQPTRRRTLLFAWGMASTIYVWFVIALILTVARTVLEPYGLTPVADVISVLTLFRVVVFPAVQLTSVVLRSNGKSRMNWPRFVSRFGLVAVGLVALVLVPLPHTLTVPASVQPVNVQRVFAQSPGTLSYIASPGTPVSAGDVIASLSDVKTELAVIRLRGEWKRQQARLTSLQMQQTNGDKLAALQVDTATERLADLRQRLEKRQQESKKLTLRANRDGVVLDSAYVDATGKRGELAGFSGVVTARENANCFVDRETVLCFIGDPSSAEVTLTVTQDEIAEFQVGDTVSVQLDQSGPRVMRGQIKSLARAASVKGSNWQDTAESLNKSLYQVRVTLDTDQSLIIGDAGHARIAVAPSSLARRIVNYVGRTFRSPL